MTLMETTELLGNVGEFVGALAVVLTLIYLAMQVRQSREATEQNTRALDENRRLVRAQSQWELTRRLEEINYQALESVEIASIFVRGGKDPAGLDEVERRIYEYRLDGYFNMNLNVLRLARDGFIDEELLAMNDQFMREQVLVQPGAHDYWQNYQQHFPAYHREHLNAVLASIARSADAVAPEA